MLTYILIDSLFLAIGIIGVIIGRHNLQWARIVQLGVIMLVITIIFDNIIIGLHIVSYNPGHILGIYVYKVPIEDLAYVITGSLLIPYLWERQK